MKKINTFEQFHSQFNNDFIGQWAQMLGMTREEYVAHYATATIGSGIDEELRPDEEAIPGGASAGGSMSIEDIAKHHGVDLRELIDQYEMGIKVELEHTDDNQCWRYMMALRRGWRCMLTRVGVTCFQQTYC